MEIYHLPIKSNSLHEVLTTLPTGTAFAKYEERCVKHGDRPYEYLAKFGYTSDMKYKYLIVFFIFLAIWQRNQGWRFLLIFFPSLLVIKVEIFNCPFYIYFWLHTENQI